MKTEVRQEVIESTIEIDGTPVFLSPPPTPRLTSTRESAPETASENLNSLRSPSPNATAMSPNPNIIPTVQVKLEVVGEKEDGAEMINESRETSDIFCRFCYQTFSNPLNNWSTSKRTIMWKKTKMLWNQTWQTWPSKISATHWKVSSGRRSLNILKTECYYENVKMFQCKFCEREIKSFHLLYTKVKHKEEEYLLGSKIHEEDCKILCELCDKKIISENSKNCHGEHAHVSKTLPSSDLKFKLCYRTFKMQWKLKSHIQRGHRNDKEFLNKEIKHSDLKFPCAVCHQKTTI